MLQRLPGRLGEQAREIQGARRTDILHGPRTFPEYVSQEATNPDDPYNVDDVASFALDTILFSTDVFHRRVEQITIASATTIRRQISTDMTIPPRPDGAPIPLLMLPSRALHRFDVRAADGTALPVLTKEQSTRIEMRIRDEADAFPDIKDWVPHVFERGFLLWVDMGGIPSGTRVVVKVGFDESTKLRRVRRWPFTRSVIWRAQYESRALTPQPASYHAEVIQPSGLELVWAGWRRFGAFDDGASAYTQWPTPDEDIGHLYISGEDNLKRTWGVDVVLGIPDGVLRTAAFGANQYAAVVLLGGFVVRHFLNVRADPGTLVVVLLAFPALAGALVLDTTAHRLTARLFTPLKNLVSAAFFLVLIGTAASALDTERWTSFPVKQYCWLGLGVLAQLAALSAWFLPHPDQIRARIRKEP